MTEFDDSEKEVDQKDRHFYKGVRRQEATFLVPCALKREKGILKPEHLES